MMRKSMLAIFAALPLMTGGCVQTVWDVATMPVKAAGKAADWATTSQDEADRNYGRKAREKEAREGKERRKAEEACRKDKKKCAPYQGYRASDNY